MGDIHECVKEINKLLKHKAFKSSERSHYRAIEDMFLTLDQRVEVESRLNSGIEVAKRTSQSPWFDIGIAFGSKITVVECKLEKSFDEYLKDPDDGARKYKRSGATKYEKLSEDNAIYISYREMVWCYRKKVMARIQLGKLDNNKQWVLDPSVTAEKVDDFLLKALRKGSSPAELVAVELGNHAKKFRLALVGKDKEEKGKRKGKVSEQTWKEVPQLVKDMYEAYSRGIPNSVSRKDFLDLLAETATFVRFVLWVEYKGDDYDPPPAFALMRKMVRDLDRAVEDSEHEKLKTAREDILEYLDSLPRDKVLKSVGDLRKSLYEDFLQCFDKEKRRSNGTWYTPVQVAYRLVRILAEALREIGYDGLRDESLKFFDKAAGTGTLLLEVIKQIKEEVESEGDEFPWYKEQSKLAQRIFGAEINFASYSFFKWNLSHVLGEDFDGMFLADSLHEGYVWSPEKDTPITRLLRGENRRNLSIKDIPVHIANPPYVSPQIHGGNPYKHLIPYKGGRLDNVCCAFLAQITADARAKGKAAMAIVFPRTYLYNKSAGALRQDLRETFDTIRIVDLHGDANNTKKMHPNDVGVFDIKEGVCLIIGTRSANKKSNASDARVFYTHFIGSRKDKFAWLLDDSMFTPDQWIEIVDPDARGPMIPGTKRPEFENFWPLLPPKTKTQTFTHCCGEMVTGGDSYFLGLTEEAVETSMNAWAKIVEDKHTTRTDKRDQLRKTFSFDQKKIKNCHRTPFNYIKIYWDPSLIDQPRLDINAPLMMEGNSALVFLSGVMQSGSIPSAIATSAPTARTVDLAKVAPMYVLRAGKHGKKLVSNLLANTISMVERTLGIPFAGPEDFGVYGFEEKWATADFFHYLYGILWDPEFQRRYGTACLTETTRVPRPCDVAMAKHFSAFGRKLWDLHLPENWDLKRARNAVGFDSGSLTDCKLGKLKWANDRLYVNEKQSFHCPEHVWNFTMGGKKVARAWLETRKELSGKDVGEMRNLIYILDQTHRLVSEKEEFDWDNLNSNPPMLHVQTYDEDNDGSSDVTSFGVDLDLDLDL